MDNITITDEIKDQTTQTINDLMVRIHEGNKKASWWTDLTTKDLITPIFLPETNKWQIRRNIGELLCLVHSEISEANLAKILNLNDDKLPHLGGEIVELADTSIRILDILGSFKYKYRFIELEESDKYKYIWDNVNFENPYPQFHITVSETMECFRKSKTEEGCLLLIMLFNLINLYCALVLKDNIYSVIEEKLEYNAKRADHKIENREAEGGKLF